VFPAQQAFLLGWALAVCPSLNDNTAPQTFGCEFKRGWFKHDIQYGAPPCEVAFHSFA
jgi:hypothetical protein